MELKLPPELEKRIRDEAARRGTTGELLVKNAVLDLLAREGYDFGPSPSLHATISAATAARGIVPEQDLPGQSA